MTATTPGGYMLQQSEGADDMEDIEILNTKDRHLIQDRDDILPISHTYHFSLTVLSMCELFRKRKFLSVVMPDSSKQLHLRHYDVYGDSKPASQLLRRVISPSPSKMSLIRQLLESIPEREREMEKEDYSKCTLRAKKGYDRSSGRSVMVFKRSRPNKKKQPCGMVDCPVCGVFWRMEMEDLEKRVPGLVSEQVVPKQSLRKRVGTSPAPSTVGSTTSTLTEFTEISEISQELLGHSFDSGIPTPSSTQSSATFCGSSIASTQSTPTKSSKNGKLNGPYDLPSPSSSATLADLSDDSKLFNGQHLPVHPSVSALNEFGLRPRRSNIFKNSAPSVTGSSSGMSTLTEFSELDTASSLSTPPSSLSSIPLTVSSASTTSTPRSPHKVIKVRKHREMTKFTDGSEWIPATLARVQEYIASQGERRLPLSYRLVVARRAQGGSTVGAKFEKGIQKVDLKAGVKPQTRAEVLSLGLKHFPNDGYQAQKS